MPRKLYRAAQTREIDRIATAEYGIASAELMRRAAHAAFAHLSARYAGARNIVVVCGPGNNGGDGYLLAARARETGMHARALAMPPASEGARAAAHIYESRGGEVCADASLLDGADLIVDALFGTGLTRAPQGDAAAWIARINAASCPVLALDMPSGLSDGGYAFSPCVRADCTVTFIGMKFGLLSGDGREHAGEIVFAELQVDAEMRRAVKPVARVIAPPKLPRRSFGMHKGNAGRVIVAGGARGMFGAALLASEAAMRTGAGLTTLATLAAHVEMAALHRPELMSADALEIDFAHADAIALGPGLGTGEWSHRVFEKCIDGSARMVVDADALNLLAQHPRRSEHWVLTPHPGEAARLLQCTLHDVQFDRLAAAREIVTRFGGACVLKGAGSLVADAESVLLCDLGNPGMASGGMGDALTGIIAALLAQNIAHAAAAGVWLHARAADLAACRGGMRGLLARDVIALLPEVLDACESCAR